MEGFEKSTNTKLETESNIESLNDWRSLKAEAEGQAKDLINQISDYEDLDALSQMDALKTLLVDLESDNKNRFVAEVVASKLSLLLENERHFNRLAQLEMS